MSTKAKSRRERRRLLERACERRPDPQFIPPACWIDDRTPHYLPELGLHHTPYIPPRHEPELPRVIRTRCIDPAA